MSDKELHTKIAPLCAKAFNTSSCKEHSNIMDEIIALVREYCGYKDPTMVSMGTAHEADIRADQTRRCIDAAQEVYQNMVELKDKHAAAGVGIVIKKLKVLEGENKNFNLKNWKYCHKHGGIGFVSDCVECNKEGVEDE